MPRTGLSAEELKQTAVRIASARITSQGYARLRMTDVAAEIGVSHAALYAHFRDKAALLDAVVDCWLITARHRLKEIAEGPGSAEDRLETFFVERVRLKREGARRDPELHEAYCQVSDRLRDVVTGHLDDMQATIAVLLRQTIPTLADPAHAAAVLQTALIGFNHPRLVRDFLHIDDATTERRLRDTLRTMLRGLRADPTA
ncbi:TetR family transcriptional regulator [Pseudooceanicola sp. CBS1P-1]|uniref:TetR family transcriptional regulator n=1 Tax=Pseudooceanicola albus TaxID=2692189 RepID=A0A6L7G925_9RHOB|nr:MULTISPECIES: TetR/AcrR family transcriptional regulator [Pseudooceanicola]MBT9382934.1 TetR family transcriptional regulator [Pseudooceanicola endophyticus]MXN20142.1 TetR family transcriptional regulator [Pseudooceanicola albus]